MINYQFITEVIVRKQVSIVCTSRRKRTFIWSSLSHHLLNEVQYSLAGSSIVSSANSWEKHLALSGFLDVQLCSPATQLLWLLTIHAGQEAYNQLVCEQELGGVAYTQKCGGHWEPGWPTLNSTMSQWAKTDRTISRTENDTEGQGIYNSFLLFRLQKVI